MIHRPTRRQFIKYGSIAAGVALTGCGARVLVPPNEKHTLVVGADVLPDIFTMQNTNKSIIGTAELPYVTSAQQPVVRYIGEQGEAILDQSMLGELSPEELENHIRENVGVGGAVATLYFEQPVALTGLTDVLQAPPPEFEHLNPPSLVTLLSNAYKGISPREVDFTGVLELGRFGRSIRVEHADISSARLPLDKAYVLGPRDLDKEYVLAPTLSVVGTPMLD